MPARAPSDPDLALQLWNWLENGEGLEGDSVFGVNSVYVRAIPAQIAFMLAEVVETC